MRLMAAPTTNYVNTWTYDPTAKTFDAGTTGTAPANTCVATEVRASTSSKHASGRLRALLFFGERRARLSVLASLCACLQDQFPNKGVVAFANFKVTYHKVWLSACACLPTACA